MNRRDMLNMSAAMSLGLSLVSQGAVAQQAEADKVKAAIDGFYEALSARDLGKMDIAWAHDADAMLFNPRDKGFTIGWEAIKKNFADVFAFWSELRATRTSGSIHVNGTIARAISVAEIGGKLKDGTAAGFTSLGAHVLEKRDGKWLLVSHSAWRAPQ